MSSLNVGLALRNSPKGQIKYDKFWVEEGRTKEVLDEISERFKRIKLSISPRVLDALTAEACNGSNSNACELNETTTTVSIGEKRKKPVHLTDAYFYELQSETELPILQYEEERLQYIQDVFTSKRSEFDNHSSELQQQIKQEYLLLKRKNELDARRRVAILQKIEDEIIEEAKRKAMLQKEHYQSHVQKISAKVLEAEMKQKKAEEEIRKKQQEQVELTAQLLTCHKEAQDLAAKSLEKLTLCEHPNHLRVAFSERMDQIAKILQAINNCIVQAETKELSIDDILNANVRVKEVYDIFQDIINDIDASKTKALKSYQEKISSFSFKDFNSNDNGTQSTIVPNSSIPNSETLTDDAKLEQIELMAESSTTDTIKEDEKKILLQYIAIDAVEEHERIVANLQKIDSLLQPLKTDPRNKKYRFELQKAINTPINSLSSNSGSQIKTKVNKLLSILAGKYPEMFQRDLSRDAAAYSFCTYLMGKQFVEQGDTQISAQHSTAFPIALAVLGVWSKKPDVGDLILGHFYTRCPYLVPFYPPRHKGQSDAEYFKTLGYRLDDEDNIEEKYKFLNRMSGYVRLYAAIIVSPLPSNSASPHPHGLSWGWKWLSRMLNLDPRPDVTATVLFDFLEVAGHSLQKVYGKQFKKIIHIMCKDYFQRIKLATPGGTGGPIERLETFLQQTAKKGYISPPTGFLEAGFWNR